MITALPALSSAARERRTVARGSAERTAERREPWTYGTALFVDSLPHVWSLNEHRADRAVLEDGLEPVALREGKALCELAPSFGGRAERVGDLHAVLELEQALGMRSDRHAQADDADANHLNP